MQTTYANATRQAIALGTSGSARGQNELRVDIFSISNEGAGRENALADRPLNEDVLTSEAEAALPGVVMRRSLTYVQNQYGPFGYALGRAPGGDMCIYAWQRIATSEINVSLFNRRATVSVRLRLCQPNATETSLVAAMMSLHINASLSSGSWAPEPKEVSPNLGAAGVPIGPSPLSAGQDDNTNPAPASRPKRRVPRRAAAPNPASAPAPAGPAENGIAIPPPPAALSPGAPAIPVPPLPEQGAQP